MKVLVISEHDNVSIGTETLHAVTAASELVLLGADEVHVLVVADSAPDVAIAATRLSGVARVIYAEDASWAHRAGDGVAAQVLALAGPYSHILLPATTWGNIVASRVAAKLDVARVSNVTGIISANTFEQSIFAGNTITTVRSAGTVKVLTVRPCRFDAAGQGGTATIECADSVADARKRTSARRARPQLALVEVMLSEA